MDAGFKQAPVPVPGESAGEQVPTDALPSGATVPLVEESLAIGKRTVDKGGYRITKRVSTRQETVDELLRDQQVLIERRPLGVTLADGEIPVQRYEGDVLVIPVVQEILVTERRLVLVEEVRVTRTLVTRREPQQVTLRKEEISVERLGADDVSVFESS